ncbi:Uncharacterized protein QTN25_009867 [Entamoeba marina]
MGDTTQNVELSDAARNKFEEFKQRINDELSTMEKETIDTEKETSVVLQLNAKTNSNAQFMLSEINDFGREMERLKQDMSDAQQ